MRLYDRTGNEITLSAGSNQFANSNFVFIGDSFSSPGKWQTEMQKHLNGTNLYNAAIDGCRWSNTHSEETSAYYRAERIIDNITVTPDIIMCLLGVNDGANGVELGTVTYSNDYTEFNRATFAGGVQATIARLQNAYPDAVIYVGWTPAGGNCNWTTSAAKVDEYVEMMKEVCLMYGVEYIETRTCGISKYSDIYADCWEAGTGGGHPTEKGHIAIGKYMARIVSSTV